MGKKKKESIGKEHGTIADGGGQDDLKGWAVSHTDSAGLQEARPEQPTTGVARGGAQWPTPDTESERQPSFDTTGAEVFPTPEGQALHGRSGYSFDEPPTWDNFPTVSPVCFRNDGLSNRLSGITFSKWRNEGIKAMGNAVVPQVVYQIFKAIQQYEDQS